MTVRYGDYDRPESLPAAFEGADRLYLISLHELGHRVTQHRNAVDAAVAAGVRHIVYTSYIMVDPACPSTVVPDHLRTHELLDASGLDITYLRNGLYAETPVTQILPPAVARGVLVDNTAHARGAFVHRDDCAAVAAEVLTSSGHEGAPTTSPVRKRSVSPTSPRSPPRSPAATSPTRAWTTRPSTPSCAPPASPTTSAA